MACATAGLINLRVSVSLITMHNPYKKPGRSRLIQGMNNVLHHA
jgi:hypothetical protein